MAPSSDSTNAESALRRIYICISLFCSMPRCLHGRGEEATDRYKEKTREMLEQVQGWGCTLHALHWYDVFANKYVGKRGVLIWYRIK